MSEDDGKRWYDPHKMTIALAAIVLGIVSWWGSLVWAMARNAELKNVEQDSRITLIEQKIGDIDKRTDRIEGKVDKLLERAPK